VRDLLLLHGALGSASQLEPLAGALAEDMSLRVHHLDFEGHGGAPLRDRPFRIVHFAENLRDWLERNVSGPIPIFGYSMGGYVALHLAAAEPERVRSVMTLGTRFRWTAEAAEREGRMMDPRAIEEKVPHFARALAERHASGWELVLDRTREMMRTLGENPVIDDDVLRSIAIPVRIGVGDRDTTVSVEESAGVARVLPRGELEVFPSTPHPIEKVDVARLARAIAEVAAVGSSAAR
jgi:pimeloyl-ACP methyl ester carboxylesterase